MNLEEFESGVDHEALLERATALVDMWAKDRVEDQLDLDMLADFAFPIGVASLMTDDLGGDGFAQIVMPCLIAAYNLGRQSVMNEGRTETNGQ